MDGDAGRAVRRVVVVGGGTAGWMAATALVTLLPGQFALTLVESEAIGIVGVGEATLPHIRAFNARIGIDEAAFMAATRGTFKLGIEFRDWGAIGDSYVHPFGTYGPGHAAVQADSRLERPDFHQLWLRMAQEGGDPVALDRLSMGVQAARELRFRPPSDDAASLASTYGYAYQFDATLYAPYLRSLAEERGAERVEGRIVTVEQDQAGDIAAVILDDGRRIAGDLFIDCSGFRSLLLGETLAEPYEDWSRWLPCDRAVAVPCRTAGPVTPYTSAIAMPAGWRWRIPLQHRTGNGYVYSSAHIADEDARDALIDALEGEPLAEPRFLSFTAGRRRRGWVRNCVGVGLAGGFLEPLESTSIHLIQVAISTLVELFPDDRDSPVDRDEFNRLLDLEYDLIRDFLILHYHASARDDSDFWRERRAAPIPDTLAAKIALFRRRGRIEQHSEGIFRDVSWLSVYFGQGIMPEGRDARADLPGGGEVAATLAGVADGIATVVAAMPLHGDYIAAHCAMAGPA